MFPVVEKIQGNCADGNGKFWPTKPREIFSGLSDPEVCLRACLREKDATGCTYDGSFLKCYVHTGQIVKGGGHDFQTCWKIQ